MRFDHIRVAMVGWSEGSAVRKDTGSASDTALLVFTPGTMGGQAVVDVEIAPAYVPMAREPVCFLMVDACAGIGSHSGVMNRAKKAMDTRFESILEMALEVVNGHYPKPKNRHMPIPFTVEAPDGP